MNSEVRKMSEELQEVIESYNSYIQNVATGSMKIAEYLRQDEIAEAMQLILHFSEGMGWLTEAAELLTKNDVKVQLEVANIHEFLNEINSGLEIQDYVLVADMFEYEIAPFFAQAVQIEGIQQ